jgi:hypothetical protein
MDPLFQVHRLNTSGQIKAKFVAEQFNELLSHVQAQVPVGRELAIVKTKLEEACFFAKKAIANDPANQHDHDPANQQ